MATVPYEGARLDEQRRPTLWKVATGVLVGYLVASVALLLVAYPLSRLGVVRRDGLLSSPFPGGGAWAVVSHLTAIAAATAAAAALMRPFVESRIERSVSWLRLWGILVVTGLPPIVPRGVLPLTPVLAFLAASVLVHAYAIDAPPTSLEDQLGRWRRETRVALVALAGAAVLAAGAYAITHPFLQGQSGFSTVSSIPTRDGVAAFELKHGGSYTFELASARPVHPHVTGARLTSLEQSFPPARVTVGRRDGQTLVTIAFRPTNGSCTGPDRAIDRVVIEYRLLSRAFSQPIVLHDSPPTIRCSPS